MMKLLYRGACVMTFGFALAVASVGAIAAEDQPGRIQATGEGIARLTPDMAVMTLTVTREGETARAALDKNSKAMADVINAMEDEGVAKRDLQTAGFNIHPKYVYPKPRNEHPPRIVGYTVRNSLTVRVRNLEKLGELLDKSVSLGVNEGGNISFSNDDPAEALADARAAAVKDAMAKARIMADAAGVKLGDILELSEYTQSPQPRPMRMESRAMVSDAAPVPIAAGENSYKIVVSMVLAIDQ